MHGVQGRATRLRRLVAIGMLGVVGSIVVSAVAAPSAGAGLPWWWPWPTSSTSSTTSTSTTATTQVPSGRPILAIQGPDPLVLTVTAAQQVFDVVVKNVGPVDDTSGFGISVSGTGSLGVSTGTCSRALTKAGTPGDTCAIRLTVPANAWPGTRTLTVTGGPRATPDTLTIHIVRP
jgi:hypothetical protein